MIESFTPSTRLLSALAAARGVDADHNLVAEMRAGFGRRVGMALAGLGEVVVMAQGRRPEDVDRRLLGAFDIDLDVPASARGIFLAVLMRELAGFVGAEGVQVSSDMLLVVEGDRLVVRDAEVPADECWVKPALMEM